MVTDDSLLFGVDVATSPQHPLRNEETDPNSPKFDLEKTLLELERQDSLKNKSS